MNYYSGMGIQSSIFRCVLSKYLYTPLCSHIHLRACIFSSAMAEPRWSPTQGWLFFVWPYSLFENHFPRSFATLVIESSYSLLPLASLQVFSSWPWFIDSGVAIHELLYNYKGRFSAKPNIFAEQKYVSEANQSAEGKILKLNR